MLELSKDTVEIGIISGDHDAMMDFYGNVLGLASAGKLKVPGIGTLNRFALGPATIKLVELEEPRADRPVPGEPQDATGIRYWTAFISNLDDVVARLKEAGVSPIGGINEPAPGIRYIVANDPDGNCFELVEGI